MLGPELFGRKKKSNFLCFFSSAQLNLCVILDEVTKMGRPKKESRLRMCRFEYFEI